MHSELIKGRFAPSPSGRMHFGNIYTAVLSWLSVKSRGGKWILRIEDLDPQRSKMEYAKLIEDDLHWLGLEWDEGGIEGKGDNGPYLQSRRHDIYEHYLGLLKEKGVCYPCHCTRADILATQAPHESDGRVVYKGTCRPERLPAKYVEEDEAAVRLAVPDIDILFSDHVKGLQSFNLASQCGDFVLRRGDGAWSYQLAVVVDDALMGVTEVVRGDDLLLSAAQQIYLNNLLGFNPPAYIHVPLICNSEGVRLSKRDRSYSMEEMRKRHAKEEILGMVAHSAHIIEYPQPLSLNELLAYVRKFC